MNSSSYVEVKGHIFDSLILPKVIDKILENGAECKVKDIKIGAEKEEQSYAKIKITAPNQETLNKILQEIQMHGAMPVNNPTKVVEIKGHIIDSLTLPKIMDTVIDYGARCEVESIDIGVEKSELSLAKLKITATNDETMQKILNDIVKQGAIVY